MYVEYVNNYNKSSELLDKLRKKNKSWAQFEEVLRIILQCVVAQYLSIKGNAKLGRISHGRLRLAVD